MRQRSRIGTLLTLASGALLIGCQVLPGAPTARTPVTANAQSEIPSLRGHVQYPGDREIAATTGTIVSRATVSIMDAAGQTVAATLTDAAGNFTLSVNGAFTPTAGAYYTVEAIKGLVGNTSAGHAVRMRTLLQWTGTAWNSCTGGATIAISPTTTAVAIIKYAQAAVTFADTMGTVTGATVTSGNATLAANWQAVQNLVTDMLWRDVDPVGRIGFSAGVYSAVLDQVALVQPNLSVGTFANTSLMLDGSLQLTGSLPRPKSNNETSFDTGLAKAGTVATDGTYLYLCPWTTPGVWSKVGTGFGGSTEGTVYTTYANRTTMFGPNAAFYGGYLYVPYYSNTLAVERLNTTSGATDSVAFPSPLIFRNTGLSGSGGDIYLNTDGKYFYNGSYAISGGVNNGYTVRIFDPANGFALVRQITGDGANTPLANTSYYSDSMFVDGVYFYCMEWAGGGGIAARMRRYRLSDGQLEAETTFSQDYPTDDPLTGAYDPVNNKFWFANYQTGVVHRTAGRSFPASGTWISEPLDTGGASPVYGRLSFNGVAVDGQTVKLRLRTASDAAGLESAPWYGPTGRGDSYTVSGTPINAVHRERWVQIQATLAPDSVTRANTTPRLYGVTVEAIR